MNDSRDFQDAESVRSGNSHVTSQPVSIPPHPILGGMLRRAAKHLGHTWKIGKRFCTSSCVLFSTLSAGIESMEFRKRRIDSLINSGEEWETKNQFKIRDASLDRQPIVLSSLVRETLSRIMALTNDDCRFQIFILTNSPHQQRLVVGRYDSRLRYVLVHNFHGSFA